MDWLVNLSYIAAAILFILGIKKLGRIPTARQGNRLSAIGMLIAVVVTLFDQQILSFVWIIVGLIVGGAIGAFAAQRVRMTAMPELVALFNGFGGMASLLVGATAVSTLGDPDSIDALGFILAAVFFAVLIGGVTFTGSLFAFGKLSGKLSGSPFLFKGQKPTNAGILAAIVLFFVLFLFVGGGQPSLSILVVGIILALALGALVVLPVGGGDMPVIISLLNSLSGLAASAAGFAISNNVLVVAGCLVGASGLILTIIMCKAMNRSLSNVLFGGFGVAPGSPSQSQEGELKAISSDDAWYLLEAASNVIVVPGYGMAVAQAQHVVKELGGLLEANGCQVQYAIHPVAGRMPGHMNVLLAEADVPYEQLVEMAQVNPNMEQVDVAIVIGANDVVNPAASEDQSSPLYGMPIIEVHRAKTVFVLKRGQGAGFSGLVNGLFTMPNTRMLYGDAKSSILSLVNKFKEE